MRRAPGKPPVMCCAAASLEHAGLVYESEDGFLATTEPFVRAGVEEGATVLVAVGEANERLLRDRLGDAALGIVFVSQSDFYAKPALVPAAYAAHGGRDPGPGGVPLRTLGELPWNDRSDVAVREWTRVEAIVTHAFSAWPAKMLCPYDARSLPEPILEAARMTHAEIHDGAKSTPSADYVPGGTYLKDMLREPLPVPAGPVAELEIGSDFALARRFAAARAAEAGLAPDLIEDLTLAVGELAANAVTHGSDPRRVRVWTEGQRLVCEMRDRGSGFDDPTAGMFEPSPSHERGWGLWLAHRLCDYVETRSCGAGTVVRVHVDQRVPLHLDPVTPL